MTSPILYHFEINILPLLVCWYVLPEALATCCALYVHTGNLFCVYGDKITLSLSAPKVARNRFL